jgi:hypothetical protein
MVEQTLPYRGPANQTDFFSVLNVGIEKITPQIIENLCRAQLDRKIQAGFHRVLGESPLEYESDFVDAFIKASRLNQRDVGSEMLVLVEPRIPMETQLELLSINLHPSVLHLPSHEQTWTPYPVRIGIVDNPSGWTKRELIQSLPDVMRPANLFEAVNADLSILLKDKKSVIVPNLQKSGVHCLQKLPDGKVELSYMRGFYGPEDSDSTDNNLYTRRRFHDAGMLASYLDKV